MSFEGRTQERRPVGDRSARWRAQQQPVVAGGSTSSRRAGVGRPVRPWRRLRDVDLTRGSAPPIPGAMNPASVREAPSRILASHSGRSRQAAGPRGSRGPGRERRRRAHRGRQAPSLRGRGSLRPRSGRHGRRLLGEDLGGVEVMRWGRLAT